MRFPLEMTPYTYAFLGFVFLLWTFVGVCIYFILHPDDDDGGEEQLDPTPFDFDTQDWNPDPAPELESVR